MSFIDNNLDTLVTVKLTTHGRKQLLMSNSDSLITKFSLGDSDANYFTSAPLVFGEVPDISGNFGPNNTIGSSIFNGVDVINKIMVDNSGRVFKDIEPNSNLITTTIKFSQPTTIVSLPEDFKKIKTTSTDSDANLLKSIYLPITVSENMKYSSVTNVNGGYSDTVFSDLKTDEVLLINVHGDNYGELINGKHFKMEIKIGDVTYILYSSFQKTLIQSTIQDANFKETSNKANSIGSNIVFLFSDDIQKPNNDSNKSWATGYNMIKPFSQRNKEFFNLTSNQSLNLIKDKMVGYILLDKGIVVITEQKMVRDFNKDTDNVQITLSDLYTEVAQDITCIVNRGEFGISTNSTYSEGDVLRISEVGLYDGDDKLVAFGKINKQIELGVNQFLALGIKLIL